MQILEQIFKDNNSEELHCYEEEVTMMPKQRIIEPIIIETDQDAFL